MQCLLVLATTAIPVPWFVLPNFAEISPFLFFSIYGFINKHIDEATKTLFFILSISGLSNISSFNASKFNIAPGPTANFILLLKNTDGNCFVIINFS